MITATNQPREISTSPVAVNTVAAFGYTPVVSEIGGVAVVQQATEPSGYVLPDYWVAGYSYIEVDAAVQPVVTAISLYASESGLVAVGGPA